MNKLTARIARFASIAAVASTLLFSSRLTANAESGGVGSPGLPPPPPQCLVAAPVRDAQTPAVVAFTPDFYLFEDGTLIFADGSVDNLYDMIAF